VYLRLSVTDRCNLRCTYCMPAQGVQPADLGTVLSFEETVTVVRTIDEVAPLHKVRVTGGEPLVRKGLTELVAHLAEALPAAELCLTSNGVLLERFARDLAAAGLARVNVSLDSLQPERFARLTRGGELAPVLTGIRAARAAGLGPVRFNCVVQRGFNHDEVVSMTRFALDEGLQPRFLERMAIGEARDAAPAQFVSSAEILAWLGEAFAVQPRERAGTAAWYDVSDGATTTRVGLISPVSEPFCHHCDRLRLDARGRLWPCLMSADRIELRPLVRGPDARRSLRAAVAEALSHKTGQAGVGRDEPMSAIGG
jgi:GTP 3',8-cyclase